MKTDKASIVQVQVGVKSALGFEKRPKMKTMVRHWAASPVIAEAGKIVQRFC
jgi:hypothetical protein